jgi:hypothetical protein
MLRFSTAALSLLPLLSSQLVAANPVDALAGLGQFHIGPDFAGGIIEQATHAVENVLEHAVEAAGNWVGNSDIPKAYTEKNGIVCKHSYFLNRVPQCLILQ